MFNAFNRDGLEQKELYFKLKSSFELSDIKSMIGLYSIHKNGICMYVGQSKNIPSRLATHLKGKYESADFIKIYLAVNNGFENIESRSPKGIESILLSNEKLLIKELKPIENIIANYDFELPDNQQFTYFLDDHYNYHCAEIIADEYTLIFTANDDYSRTVMDLLNNKESMLSHILNECITVRKYMLGDDK